MEFEREGKTMAHGNVNLVSDFERARKSGRPVNFVYRANSDGKLRARFGSVVSVSDTHVILYDLMVSGNRSCILSNIVDGVRFN